MIDRARPLAVPLGPLAVRLRPLAVRLWPLVVRLWPLAIGLRLLIAGSLMFGPATDEPAELAGWDAERFQEIVDRQEPAWSGQPVEYPPGSVVVLDRVAGTDVVSTHRRLVGLSVAIDLATALALGRLVGARVAHAYLLIGLPLVPLGYQRLDTAVTALATVAALALLAHWDGRKPPTRPSRGADARALAADLTAGAAIAAGALTKVWPAVLLIAAVAIGRWRAAAAAIVVAGAGGAAWLALVGDGLAPIDQVLSLRGATGWHVESVPGALVALVGDDPARLELDAFRIGTLRPTLVTAGRGVAVAAMVLLAIAGRRSLGDRGVVSDARHRSERQVLALVALGAVAALLVTAPLLSPQFLVWTTPFAALLVGPDEGTAVAMPPGDRIPVGLTAAAALLTGVTLTAFGPSGLTGTVPAALLTTRNVALAALIPVCGAALLRRDRLLAGRQGARAWRPTAAASGTPAGSPATRPTTGRSGSADR